MHTPPIRRKKKWHSLFLKAAVASFVLTLGLVLACDVWVSQNARGRLVDDPEELSPARVGLVLGTSRKLANGRPNLYYRYRMEAALRLLQSGKVKYLILSGDNRHASYNEPRMMWEDLRAAGVDTGKLVLDYAGFRTLDSVVRLKAIFSCDSAILVSQPFHNERALFLADAFGIHTTGFNARDLSVRAGLKVMLREKLARVKVVWDVVVGVEPHFYGPKMPLP